MNCVHFEVRATNISQPAHGPFVTRKREEFLRIGEEQDTRPGRTAGPGFAEGEARSGGSRRGGHARPASEAPACGEGRSSGNGSAQVGGRRWKPLPCSRRCEWRGLCASRGPGGGGADGGRPSCHACEGRGGRVPATDTDHRPRALGSDPRGCRAAFGARCPVWGWALGGWAPTPHRRPGAC